uniref:Uncharacterized protein n=1 Tax=viral metagenome TaxID=1070528 RepID=A0A6H1ZRV6_9ZZZZ
MENKIQNALIAGVVGIIVTVAWNYFLQVPPQYFQGVQAGYTQGSNDTGKTISDSIQKNKVEGVCTPTSSGQFYLEVE